VYRDEASASRVSLMLCGYGAEWPLPGTFRYGENH
jgi:hypothetical protein